MRRSLLPVLLVCVPLVGALAAAHVAGARDSLVGHRLAAASAGSQCRITQRRSLVGTTRTTLRFVNRTREPVRVDWLSYSGSRVFYKRLAAGASYVQQTWLTHPWVILTNRGACVGYVIAGTTRTYVIR